MDEIGRRTFLALAAAPIYAAGPLVTFTPAEAKLVASISDCVIPAGDGPGATEAGVIYYIDRQLSGPLQRFHEAYRTGIPRFESACHARHGRSFSDLDAESRTSFLQTIESSDDAELRGFFAMVVDHTMQGFYGAPSHGGNRDEVSWKMLGIADVMEGHKH